MNIFLLNGPPRCGKTTVASLIDQLSGETQHHKFNHQVDLIAEQLLVPIGIDYEIYGEEKDEKLPGYDCTVRELQIGISDLVKSKLGDHYFGEYTVDKVLGEMAYAEVYDGEFFPPAETIVAQCGFQTEYNVFRARILEAYPKQKVHLVNILRDGCTFENDSREWVTDKHAVPLVNNGSLDDLEKDVTHLLQELV